MVTLLRRGSDWSVPCVSATLRCVLHRTSKEDSRAELDLPPRSRRLRNGAELGCIHEPVRRSQVYSIQTIERLEAKLKLCSLGNSKISSDREIKCALARTVDGVATGIAERIWCGCGEGTR